MPTIAKTRPESGAAGDPVSRARTAAKVIAAAADRIDTERELPAEVIGAMHEQGLFRLLLPRSLGGAELDPMTLAEVTQIIAAADASAAWCLGQGSGCAMSAAYLPPQVASEIWGPRNGVLAWGAGAAGKATAVPGGYRVTGRWSFASGSRHATWIGGHCKVFESDGTPRRRPDGRHAERTPLFRREQVSITDDWQVMGLRGTGSDSYEVRDFFVDDDHSLDREDPAERREDGVVYRMATTQVYAAAFAGVALGVARGALDALLALGREKTQRGATSSLLESPVFQTEIAQLEGNHRAARAYLRQSYAEVWEAVQHRDGLTLDQRADLRLAATYVIDQATDITTRVYRAAGSTAIFHNKPFERRLRDALTVSQQAQGRSTHFMTVGRHLLGLAPDTLMFM